MKFSLLCLCPFVEHLIYTFITFIVSHCHIAFVPPHFYSPLAPEQFLLNLCCFWWNAAETSPGLLKAHPSSNEMILAIMEVLTKGFHPPPLLLSAVFNLKMEVCTLIRFEISFMLQRLHLTVCGGGDSGWNMCEPEA